jgi:hypothetical protein
MTSIRRVNPRKQGEIGLGAAIAWFTADGYSVSIPLADNQPYDLVVDDGQRLSRVEIKTATHINRQGHFAVDLRTNGGNRSRSTSKAFDVTAADLLFVLTDEQRIYLIPTAELRPRAGLVLGAQYDRYVVVGAGFEPA